MASKSSSSKKTGFGWFGSGGSSSRRRSSMGGQDRTDNDGHDNNASDYDDSNSDNRDNREEKGTLADSEYARKRRQLLQLARSLETLGAGELLGEAPRIVVVGAQSTGKSSLVEGVTGINVPRDSGTCTRCPMECTILTTTAGWSCSISLRMANKGSVGFSPSLSSKSEVEVWIRRAQAAILCPHLAIDIFKTKDRDALRALTDATTDPMVLKFTNDVVVIDIYDPYGVDLSFVDLPGLVQNEEPDLVLLVNDMVKQYIKPESTIILVTVPAPDDLENQLGMVFAKQADPLGKRTIGVVTKPDGLTAGDSGKRDSWLAIFENRATKHLLQKGYYCVRLPNDQERTKGLSRRDQERLAQRFFDENAPWRSLKHTDRLGIPSLVRDISRLLVEVIQETLPKMRRAVDARLAACIEDQARLPPLLVAEDKTGEVVQRVAQFSQDMERIILGQTEDKSFVHRCRSRFRSFERTIQSSAPDFRSARDPQITQGPGGTDVERLEPAPWDGDEVLVDIPNDPITFLDVRQVIKETTGWELPHNIPYEAKERLIKGFMKHWPVAVTVCFDRTAEDLRAVVLREASDKKHFGRFPNLEKFIKSNLVVQLEHYVSHSKVFVENVVERENAPFGTQNTPHLEAMRNQWLLRYKTAWEMHDRAKLSVPHGPHHLSLRQNYEGQALQMLRELGYTTTTVQHFPRLLDHWDTFDDEIVVMADVRSYFEIVYKRFADDIPESIKLNLLVKFVKSLRSYLIEQLQLGKDGALERMQALLVEEPRVANERKRLKDLRKRLELIKDELSSFTM
ncbi:P-loop containing nucleoside triphosphate hydrolase protein [Trametes maxima]|nr:P-loop containing nucleoside triphosphate hydrolase protein [Trametes maxima]